MVNCLCKYQIQILAHNSLSFHTFSFLSNGKGNIPQSKKCVSPGSNDWSTKLTEKFCFKFIMTNFGTHIVSFQDVKNRHQDDVLSKVDDRLKRLPRTFIKAQIV